MIDRLENEVDMLERHLRVLEIVIDTEPIGILKISNETGYEHHKVRYSLRILEDENLIEPTNQGARTTEKTSDWVADLDERIDGIVSSLKAMAFEAPATSSD